MKYLANIKRKIALLGAGILAAVALVLGGGVAPASAYTYYYDSRCTIAGMESGLTVWTDRITDVTIRAYNTKTGAQILYMKKWGVQHATTGKTNYPYVNFKVELPGTARVTTSQTFCAW